MKDGFLEDTLLLSVVVPNIIYPNGLPKVILPGFSRSFNSRNSRYPREFILFFSWGHFCLPAQGVQAKTALFVVPPFGSIPPLRSGTHFVRHYYRLSSLNRQFSSPKNIMIVLNSNILFCILQLQAKSR